MPKEKPKISLDNFFTLHHYFPWLLLVVALGVFTVLLYPTLIMREHVYGLGDVADRDIKAPVDFLVEDPVATQSKRQQAIDAVFTVYDHDTTLAARLTENLNAAFTQARAVFDQTPPEQPAVSGADSDTPEPAIPAALDPPDLSAEPIRLAAQSDAPVLELAPIPESESQPPGRDSVAQTRAWELKPTFEELIGITLNSEAYQVLVDRQFAAEIELLISRIFNEILDNGVVANKEILLREAEKGIILRSITTKDETVIRKLRRYYGLEQAQTMVRIVGQPLLKSQNYLLRNLIVDVVQRLIQPNITLNKSETEERRGRAAETIKPIFYKIKAGEMVLREGERVKDLQLLKLQTLRAQTQTEQVVSRSLGAVLFVLCFWIIIYILYIRPDTRFARSLNKNLLFLTVMFIFALVLAKVSAYLSAGIFPNTPFAISERSVFYGIPLAAGSMTICVFMGLNLAIPFALVVSACTAVLLQGRFEVMIYFALNSLMAAYWIRHCRERTVFVRAGLQVGLLNVVLTSAIDIYMADFAGFKILWDAGLGFLGGIGAGIVTAGIVPLVESTFRYRTDITLLELANLERPILKQLMLKAPGTYHHSVIVGSMVEAAASAIGANPMLARVCGYYHDIGKLKQPLYFIENQRGIRNPHDKLAPSMSSLILISHIKNGVELARENKLGQEIIDTIRQHHGTSLISYFFDKAQQRQGEDKVKIDDYCYPGPKPQTKEAGLVMLADVVEAASRTLENPTPSRIQGLVQNLINKIFSDGQLDNCELTLKDLDNIAKSFNRRLYGIYHHRIEYADSPATNNGKAKNGGIDKQQSKPAHDLAEDDPNQSTGRLRRLGIS